MEQHDVEIGTRRDLVLYRIETSKNDLKSGADAPAFVVSYTLSYQYIIYFLKSLKLQSHLKKITIHSQLQSTIHELHETFCNGKPQSAALGIS